MATRKRSTAAASSRSQTDPEVDDYMRELDHPLKREIESVRRLILASSPKIREAIKWNAPSFQTDDFFATLNNPPRKNAVMLVLHTGAKKKSALMQGKLADPKGLLKWLAKDRCLVTFADAKEIESKAAALQAIVREWIKNL